MTHQETKFESPKLKAKRLEHKQFALKYFANVSGPPSPAQLHEEISGLGFRV